MPTLDYKDRTLGYAHFGGPCVNRDSPVFVFVSSEYRDTQTMDPILSQLPKEISGIIVDTTNMGQSTRLDRPQTSEEMILELEHVCSSLSIQRPVFIGYCSTAELALSATRTLNGVATVLISPFLRRKGDGFVDFFYAAMKRAILARDVYTLTVIMNTADLHSSAFREVRNHFLKDQFANQKLLQDAERFWIKTEQFKPTSAFVWEDLPSVATPVMILRGAEDALQPIECLRNHLKSPHHRLVEFDCGHQILNCRLPEAIPHICAFYQSLQTHVTKEDVGAEAWTS